MKILALDTSAEACSVALDLDGEIIGRFKHAPRRHTELILPMIEALLAEAGLPVGAMDALAFGRGPGSFTGLRIATGVAQGIALGADLPVIPVSTLAALAQRCYREHGWQRVLTAFDARMNEVYWAGYEIDAGKGMAMLIGEEAVLPPQQVAIPAEGVWHGAGNGWAAHGDALREITGLSDSAVDAGLVCRAEEMTVLAGRELAAGRVVSPEQAIPVYLRDKVAWRKG